MRSRRGILFAALAVLALQVAHPTLSAQQSNAAPLPGSIQAFGVAQEADINRTAVPTTLSYELTELVEALRVSGPSGAEQFALRRVLPLLDNLVRVVIEFEPGAVGLTELLTAWGAAVEVLDGDRIQAWVPVDRLEAVAAVQGIRRVSPPLVAVPFATSEGVNKIGAGPWQTGGFTGLGTKVGIVDLGFAGYTSLLGSELPATVVTRSFRADGDLSGNGIKHGTSVAEVVHDVAPGAQLFLVNYETEVEFDSAVDWLIEQGVGVVNHSAGWYCGGRKDGTSRMSAKVRQATQRNIVWVNAAGNAAKHHWSGTFVDSNSNGWHDFKSTDEGNDLQLSAGDVIEVCLAWDAWPQTSQNYDLFLYDSSNNVVASSQEVQSGGQPPVERFSLTVTSAGTYHFAIRRTSGAQLPQMDLFVHFKATQGQACAAEVTLTGERNASRALSELRGFRDEVLANTDLGTRLKTAYYRHSPELVRHLLVDSNLRVHARQLIGMFRPSIRELLGGSAAPGAAPVVLTRDLVDRIAGFENDLMQVASPELKEELVRYQEVVNLEQAVGQTVGDYWKTLATIEPVESVIEPQLDTQLPPLQFLNASSSLGNPADSVDVLAVGATYHGDDSLEDYSSQGPTSNGVTKPDITAPTRVCTVTSADCGGFGFAGTSASAPHVAGAAALVKQRFLLYTRAQVQQVLERRAVPLGDAGKDNKFGSGRLSLGPLPQSQPILNFDGPSGGAVTQPFSVSGWAVDRGADVDTGIDTVHAYVSNLGSGATPIFLGVPTYGQSRLDIGNLYGSQFTNSGFALTVAGLATGTYQITMYGRSTLTGTFSVARSVVLSVTAPQPNPAMQLDGPADNSTVGRNVTVAGWAIDRGAASGTGVDTIHVWAYPTDGSAAQFVGVATYGLARADIGSAFGSRFTNSGFRLTATMNPGRYNIIAFGRSTVTNTFILAVGASNVTVQPTNSNAVLFVDTPGQNTTATRPFTVSGWAVDQGSTSGTGIDAIHIWAFPTSGAAATFVGVGTYGTSRPDIGTLLGDTRFNNSGFTFSVTSSNLAAGTYNLIVFGRSTVTGSFTVARLVRVTVPPQVSHFTWPVDPLNASNGFDGPCGDWPNDANGCFWISNDGWRDAQPFQRHSYTGYGYHLGADWNLGSGSADAGLPVYAVADGAVSSIQPNVSGWGNIIFIRHNTPWGTYTSMYAHVNWASFGMPTVGQSVSKGQQIAIIGNGNGLYSYHLHLEIRTADSTIPGPAYTGSIVSVGPQSQIDPNVFIAAHR